MLCAMLNRASVAASAERIAFFSSIARWTIVRLIRISWSSSPRRALVATGTSGAPGLGRMITNPRSACTKILNRLSSTLGRMSLAESVLLRLCEISIIACSCCSGLAETCHDARGPPLTSSVAMMLEASVVVVGIRRRARLERPQQRRRPGRSP